MGARAAPRSQSTRAAGLHGNGNPAARLGPRPARTRTSRGRAGESGADEPVRSAALTQPGAALRRRHNDRGPSSASSFSSSSSPPPPLRASGVIQGGSARRAARLPGPGGRPGDKVQNPARTPPSRSGRGQAPRRRAARLGSARHGRHLPPRSAPPRRARSGGPEPAVRAAPRRARRVSLRCKPLHNERREASGSSPPAAAELVRLMRRVALPGRLPPDGGGWSARHAHGSRVRSVSRRSPTPRFTETREAEPRLSGTPLFWNAPLETGRSGNSRTGTGADLRRPRLCRGAPARGTASELPTAAKSRLCLPEPLGGLKVGFYRVPIATAPGREQTKSLPAGKRRRSATSASRGASALSPRTLPGSARPRSGARPRRSGAPRSAPCSPPCAEHGRPTERRGATGSAGSPSWLRAVLSAQGGRAEPQSFAVPGARCRKPSGDCKTATRFHRLFLGAL